MPGKRSTVPETTNVTCADCGHRAKVNGPRSTWLCPCSAINPDCECAYLNVVPDDSAT